MIHWAFHPAADLIELHVFGLRVLSISGLARHTNRFWRWVTYDFAGRP